MKELPVNSRAISSIYFSQEDGRLMIRFRNGEERLFEGVPESEAEAMASAQSPGQFYMDNIRKQFRRIAA